MVYLVINFLLYLIFLLYTLRKDKFVASNLYMYIIWLTGAFFSILYYDTPFFYLVGHVADLSLFPLPSSPFVLSPAVQTVPSSFNTAVVFRLSATAA